MLKFKQFLLILFAFVYIPTLLAKDTGITGNWLTIDYKTGKKRAIVHIYLTNQTLNGEIVSVFQEKGDSGYCTKCPGEFKNKPIQGLKFLWGLKEKRNNSWGDGRILDAQNGKIYRVKMT